MAGFRKRKRLWLAVLCEAQKGLCCHCREPMICRDPYADFTNVDCNGWLEASIEHVIPKSFFRSCGIENEADVFANTLAAHRGCNSERDHLEIADDLLIYRNEIHAYIFSKGCDYIPQSVILQNVLHLWLPFGYTVEDYMNKHMEDA